MRFRPTYADDVRSRRLVCDRGQSIDEAVLCEVPPQRVLAVDPAAQQIPGEPPARVVERGLVGELRRGERTPDVFGLHQTSAGNVPADGAHREADRVDLVQQCEQERALVPGVRMPVSVERRKACRGERLVHGAPVSYPRITLGRAPGVPSESRCEAGVQQVGVARPAAVVHQPRHHAHAELAQPTEACVGEAPVAAVRMLRGHVLPQHRIPKRVHAERGEPIEVARPPMVTRQARLVDLPVTDAKHRAFVSAPQLESTHHDRPSNAPLS